METNKFNVIVELHDLTISERKDDRYGQVVTSKSLREDDLIAIAVQRRTDLNPTTLRSSIDILKEIAIEEIAGGASVEFGLGYFGLDVRGIFIGDHASWDPKTHSLHIRVAASAELRRAIRSTHVNVRGMASSGTFINRVFDVTSGEENRRLSIGGGVNLTGSKIRIAGDNPENGLYLVDMNGDTVYKFSSKSILINDLSKLSFIVENGVTDGDYRLKIVTQYAGSSTLLKEPRSYVFDHVLAVDTWVEPQAH